MQERSRYGRVAAVYEWLARFYSAGLILATRRLALQMASGANDVLILGIGAGQELSDKKIKFRNLLAIDTSAEMLMQAEKVAHHGDGVEQSVELREQNFWRVSGEFNVVICPFFLNVFPEDNFPDISKRLN